MTTARRRYERLPPEIEDALHRAVRLEWVTIAFLLSIIAVMYLAMGNSQAMRTAWFEDLLSLVPPIAFLVALRWEKKPPEERYPYGFLNAATIAFVCASTALLVMGIWLLTEAIHDLATGYRPGIGAMSVAGHATWAGWWMIAALVYSAIPPFVLGRMKERLADSINDDTVRADADMNKADWRTALATGLGILGLGIGWWWADAVAAAVVSLSICSDGLSNLRRAARDLVDHVPTDVEGVRLDLPARLEVELAEYAWARGAAVRMREEGRFVTGEIRLDPDRGTPTAGDLALARARLLRLDWRIRELAWIVGEPVEWGAGAPPRN